MSNDIGIGELLRGGKLDETLQRLQANIRENPSDAKLRIFLFQLHLVLGNWDKALTQLNVASELDASATLMAQVGRASIQCEAMRSDVFAGKSLPLVFGEPSEWVGWMILANQLAAQGKYAEATDLRNRALEAAPQVAGVIDDKPFEWLADADSRFGPIFEAVIDGRYFWIPLQRVASIDIQPPADLRDLVWAPVNFTWTNGGTAVALMPTRYPDSEYSDDSKIKLSRLTTWQQQTEDSYVGLGQRIFTTDADEYPLLETRRITFHGDADQSAASLVADPIGEAVQ